MPDTHPPEEILEPDLPICDPHHHLWDRNGHLYLLPELLADIGGGHRIKSTMYVEASAFYSQRKAPHLRYVGETEFAVGQAAIADSGVYTDIRVATGIVGRAPLEDGASVAEVLEAHIGAGQGRFRGVRRSGAWDPSPGIPCLHDGPGFYALPSFREGFARLAGYGLTFEAFQYHHQIRDVIDLAHAFPETRIMLNHVGTPLGVGRFEGRRQEVFEDWSRHIRELARCPNVWVKLGGLGLPYCGLNPPPGGAPAQEIARVWGPYLETCLEAFGVDRSLFESNFPPDRAAGTYNAVWNAFKIIAKGASDQEKAKLFHDNAVSFYRLEV